ncbi:SRPBCC family protein [Nonomuraea sp. SYSU D8015]|uniref:SRPBCC family protein n=1 Tax=Nonomuraea sp. SYSU D8015 TaxID=2593644 RepID=UPI0016604AC9|nr:SRPBCC family protein [Nonomuraea sp. SYSU D8015]
MLFLPRFMPRSMFRLAAGAAAGYLLAVRPWHLRWGAEDAEVYGEMAGDDVVRNPQYKATRAVTVDAPPAAVWPWLVRLGGYAPGAASSAPAAPAAEQEGLKVGDTVHSAPDGSGYVVEQVDPPHTLVLAHRGPDAATTCSIALREVADGKTRMVFRVRIRAEPGLRGTAYLARMDVSDFVAMRSRMLTVKSRAESAS